VGGFIGGERISGGSLMLIPQIVHHLIVIDRAALTEEVIQNGDAAEYKNRGKNGDQRPIDDLGGLFFRCSFSCSGSDDCSGSMNIDSLLPAILSCFYRSDLFDDFGCIFLLIHKENLLRNAGGDSIIADGSKIVKALKITLQKFKYLKSTNSSCYFERDGVYYPSTPAVAKKKQTQWIKTHLPV
jgi:hypothetical protein